MALPTDRNSFKQYILRKLGKPVIQINVSDDQVEDRIDEAINKFWQFHYDGTLKTYWRYQVTPTDIQNNYITLPANFIGVVSIFPINALNTSGGLFSARYQLVLNDILYMGYENLNNYVQIFQHLQELEQILTGNIPIRYNRVQNILYLDTQLSDRIGAGEYLIVEAYQTIDPAEFAAGWSEVWLIEYATALVQQQWGQNLSKFVGVTLPGGNQFNGEKILADANQKIEKLETQLIDTWSLPCDMMVG